MAGSPKKRARRERIAAAADPLDEPARSNQPPLQAIPYNKLALTDDGREAVERALLDGYARNQIAKALGTTVATLRRIINDDPVLTDAVDCRKDVEEQELREILMGQARMGDTVAGIFLAKAQFGWRDRDDTKVKLEADSGGGVLVVPGTMPLDEWSLAALKQQKQYREASDEVQDQLAAARHDAARQDAPRLGTPGIEGLRLRKPTKGELPN
ncbi:hypothetical protein [Parasphingorhabdus sp.]|uniref:hypothetical protein n=1 Tax=Parasphingorhabdus sp. TaxID=2709688 RepID=UPI0032EB9988